MDSRNATSPVARVTIIECPNCGANGECQPGAARPVQGNNYYRNASCLCDMGYQGMRIRLKYCCVMVETNTKAKRMEFSQNVVTDLKLAGLF